MTMETLKIDIKKDTDWKGVEYYYLYVNDKYVDCHTNLETVKGWAKTAEAVFITGRHERTLVSTQMIER